MFEKIANYLAEQLDMSADEITADTIYLYTFENAVPVAVSFTVGEGNTISASGTFLIAEELCR